MMRFITLLAIAAAIVGCNRIGLAPGLPEPQDGMTAAEYNWWYIGGLAWPVLTPFLRFVPIVGPILQAVAANISWSALATKQQKLADKGTT